MARFPFRPRNVDRDDKRSPMLRLLQDCNCKGQIQVDYAQQWPTLFKARRLGYLDGDCRLTDAAVAFLAQNQGA